MINEWNKRNVPIAAAAAVKATLLRERWRQTKAKKEANEAAVMMMILENIFGKKL
jgi:hypothetical protein